MKKIFYLAAFLVFTGVLVQAQTMPVIPWDQRRADLYYYGSNWVDSSMMQYPEARLYLSHYKTVPAYGSWIGTFLQEEIGQHYIGRPCVTDQPLKVLGIAAPLVIMDWGHFVDTSRANRVPEYFRLYQHENDSIYFVDEARWDTTTPQYKFQVRHWDGQWGGGNTTVDYDLYEAYFEKPAIVHDTFYVGGTNYNNLMHGPSSPETDPWGLLLASFLHPATKYHFFWRLDTIYGSISMNPNYFIVRSYYHSQSLYPMGPEWPTFDTTKFVIHTDYPNLWLPFFAIFDTNFVPGLGTYDDSCLAPTGLHTEGSTATSVTLAWNAGGETLWQLSVYEDGTNPNDGLLLQTPINYAFIDSLELGHWYRAQVRTLCDTDVFGDWSDTVLFLYGTLDDTITCQKPTNLAVHSTDVGMVVLTWAENTEVTSWLVEVGSADTPVGEGAVTTAPVPFTMRNGLDTAMWHWARVRSKCGTDWYSLWTDTVMFYIPGDGSGDNPNDTTQAINLVEQYTYLMPNPARDEVTVASSFRVKAVELYGSDGKLLLRKEVNAVGTTLSLEGLPAGIYFVRVRTSAGVTTKRLVVE